MATLKSLIKVYLKGGLPGADWSLRTDERRINGMVSSVH